MRCLMSNPDAINIFRFKIIAFIFIFTAGSYEAMSLYWITTTMKIYCKHLLLLFWHFKNQEYFTDLSHSFICENIIFVHIFSSRTYILLVGGKDWIKYKYGYLKLTSIWKSHILFTNFFIILLSGKFMNFHIYHFFSF